MTENESFQELLLWAVEDNTLPSAFLSLPSPPFSILTPSLSHYLITVDSAGSLAMVTVEGEKVRMASEVNLQGRRLRGKRLRLVTTTPSLPFTGLVFSVVKCEMSHVGGRESAVVMCGGGEVFVCAVDTGGLTLVSSLNLGVKVDAIIFRLPCDNQRLLFSSPSFHSVCVATVYW